MILVREKQTDRLYAIKILKKEVIIQKVNISSGGRVQTSGGKENIFLGDNGVLAIFLVYLSTQFLVVGYRRFWRFSWQRVYSGVARGRDTSSVIQSSHRFGLAASSSNLSESSLAGGLRREPERSECERSRGPLPTEPTP